MAREMNNEEDHPFPFYLLILMPNTISLITRAYRSNDASFAVLALLVFSIIALFECHMLRYISMSKNKKSSQKLWVKLTMWFLYTAISFGFVHQFAFFLTRRITVVLFIVVFVCSVLLLYVLVIVDLVNDWKIRRSGQDDEIGFHEHQALLDGKLNHADLVLENV